MNGAAGCNDAVLEVWMASVAELESGTRVARTIGSVEIVAFAHRGEFFAYRNVCPHRGGPAAEGIILGRVEPVIDDQGRLLGEAFSRDVQHIVCPWHGYEYELSTGICAADRRLRLRRYETVVRDGEVYVLVPDRI